MHIYALFFIFWAYNYTKLKRFYTIKVAFRKYSLPRAHIYNKVYTMK